MREEKERRGKGRPARGRKKEEDLIKILGPRKKTLKTFQKNRKGALVNKVDTILSAKYDPETVAAWRRLVTGQVRRKRKRRRRR